jgi:septal ring factor EnvC (AmiA/AmiB activator)
MLDAFRRSSVRSGATGVVISSSDRNEAYDFERLESVVEDLVQAYQRQVEENDGLRRRLAEQVRELRTLEGQLLEANQKRQDVAKRVDELISQLDHLDGQLATAEH